MSRIERSRKLIRVVVTRSSVRSLDTQALLAETGWVRTLVRGLIADEATVDDVVQDAWVAALERSPESDEHRGIRAWLAAVARNLSLRTRRRAALRRQVEQAAARPEAIASGVDDLDRLQLHKLLVEVVIELPEPYRSAVTARCFDELPYDAIARRQGCSQASARQRVSRGLALLRDKLDRRFQSGRGAWCWSLAGAFELDRIAGARWSALSTGGIAVGVKGWLVTVTAALAVSATAVLWLQRSDDTVAHDSPLEMQTDVSAATSRSETAKLLEPAGAGDADRRAAFDESAPIASAEFVGVVTDTAGHPQIGAQARLLAGGTNSDDAFAEAESDEHGAFTLSLPRDCATVASVPWEVEAALEGYVTQRASARLDERVEVALPRLPQLRGRVLAPAGKRLAPPWELKAVFRALDAPAEDSRDAEIAADGTYTVANLPLGELTRISARARGFGRAEPAYELALEGDAVVTLDVELPAGAVIEGRVLDALTRGGIAGAKVWSDEYFLFNPDAPIPMTETDDEGRFRLEGSTLTRDDDSPAIRPEGLWIGVEARGYAPPSQRFYFCDLERDGICHIEITLDPEACRFAGVVLMPDGVDPAGGSQIFLIDARGNLRFATSASDGTFAVEDLAPGRLAVDVQRENGPHRLRLRKSFELDPARRATDRLVLIAGDASIAGRVLDLAGAPLAGARVSLAIHVAGEGTSLISSYTGVDTDRDGSYRLEGLPAGDYVLGLNGDSQQTPCSHPRPLEFELQRGEARVGVDFVGGACMTVQGRVDLAGRAAGELTVGLYVPGRDGVLVEAGVEADGGFQLEPVLAGAYDVVLSQNGAELARTTARPGSESGLVLPR